VRDYLVNPAKYKLFSNLPIEFFNKLAEDMEDAGKLISYD